MKGLAEDMSDRDNRRVCGSDRGSGVAGSDGFQAVGIGVDLCAGAGAVGKGHRRSLVGQL
jgi:hypothetical protein